MPLKRKIDKEAFDKLAKDVQAFYTKDGDKEEYLLDIEGVDDVDALRRAKDRLSTEAKEAKKKLKEAEDKLAELAANSSEDDDTGEGKDKAAKKREKDLKKLEDAWKEKMETAAKEAADKLASKDAHTKRTMIQAAAREIATKISIVPNIMAKAIAERLDVNFEDDEPQLIILGADGKRSSATLDQLSKEFSTNKEYAAIIVGSKASGSGAPRNPTNKPSDARSSAGDDGKPADLSKLAPKDLVTLLKERKEQQAT